MVDTEVGAAIFHRTRGVGRVVAVETREWEGQETRYLVVEMMAENYTIRIPDTSPDIRPVLSDPRIIFETLHHKAETLPDHYRTRQAEIRDAVSSGIPKKIAAAIRDLWAYSESEEGNWTTGGERLYNQALEMLAAEVAAAQNCNIEEARIQVRNAMVCEAESSEKRPTEEEE
jgi:RNA polymerase-interacting CarD/CdnL/TRCF family regulator